MLVRVEAFGRIAEFSYSRADVEDEQTVIDNSTSADLEPASAAEEYTEARFGFHGYA